MAADDSSPLLTEATRPASYDSTTHMTSQRPNASSSSPPSGGAGATASTDVSAVGLRQRLKGKGKAPDQAGDRADPWYKVAYSLENKGSVARDHLASERTYLAWLRTSLSLASIGIGEWRSRAVGRAV